MTIQELIDSAYLEGFEEGHRHGKLFGYEKGVKSGRRAVRLESFLTELNQGCLAFEVKSIKLLEDQMTD